MSYIKKNRWYITASKLKYFISFWPEAYKLKYIDEIEEEEKEKRHFVVGTAFDDLVSYGKDFFLEKYAIKEKLLKADLKKLLKKEGKKITWNELVADLEELYYWDKILLTPTEWQQVMGMYREAMRQPLADMWSEYTVQEEITAEYKTLKVKGTLDRFSKEKKMIRDWKTSWRIDYFEYNMDTSFDYVMSMAFYFVLVKIKYNVECDVILDVLGKQPPFPYYWYRLPKERLLEKVVHKIKPWLDAMIECIENDERLNEYPIDYTTEGLYGDIIHHKKWDPINRTKLMQSWVYKYLDGGVQKGFIEPKL